MNPTLIFRFIFEKRKDFIPGSETITCSHLEHHGALFLKYSDVRKTVKTVKTAILPDVTLSTGYSIGLRVHHELASI